jgi:hypothetical protein
MIPEKETAAGGKSEPPDNLPCNSSLNLASRQDEYSTRAAIYLQLSGIEDKVIQRAIEVAEAEVSGRQK